MPVLVATLFHVVHALFVKFHQLSHTLFERLQVIGHLLFEHLFHDAEVSSVGDIANGGHHLQLRCTLVDREDARIAIEALTLILHDEARTAMNLYGVISVLVGVFRVHTLCQRRKGIGQTHVFLLFGTFFGCKFTFACDVVECLVDVYIACRLVENATSCIQLSLHTREHIVHSGEVDDVRFKLSTFASVVQSFGIGGLRHANALCGDTQTGTVHQCHHVLDEAQTRFAT